MITLDEIDRQLILHFDRVAALRPALWVVKFGALLCTLRQHRELRRKCIISRWSRLRIIESLLESLSSGFRMSRHGRIEHFKER